MKLKYLATLALLVMVSPVFASDGDIIFGVASSTAIASSTPYTLTNPIDGLPHLLHFNSSTLLPEWTGISSKLEIDGSGNLNVKPFAISDVTGLQTALDAKANVANVGANFTSVESEISTMRTNITNREMLNQRLRVQTNTSGTYTWTFSHAYGASTTPIVTATAEDGTSGALTTVQITSISNTSVTVQTRRITTVLGLLTLTTNPQVFVDLRAADITEL